MVDVDYTRIPELPGVYIMKGKGERILYVGKAKNLRARIRHYTDDRLDIRKSRMMSEVKDISFIVTKNEMEALILEANLIKQYKPRFNVILRDDKNYPYIKVVMNEKWPHLEVTRRIKNDGSLYFGPYVPSSIVWEALSFIRRNFNIRPCRYRLDKPMRPCIQYQMKRCPAPCNNMVSEDDYRRSLDEVIKFLRGERKNLLEELEERMMRFSDEMRFEEAAIIRDRINILKRLWESQRVVSTEFRDIDVVGVFSKNDKTAVVILFVRNGIMTGKKEFFLNRPSDDMPEFLHGLIEVFYSKEIIPPHKILVPQEVLSKEILEDYLSKRRIDAGVEGGVIIEPPVTDSEDELVKMAMENARIFLDERSVSVERLLVRLREMLSLDRVPQSIGAFDISTTYGMESTGGFVWWSMGEFIKENYRHLRVKHIEGMNDYGMMEEVISRVIENLDKELPDILMVDGGITHLDVLKRVIERYSYELSHLPYPLAIAKDPDRLFLPHGEVVFLDSFMPPDDRLAILFKRIRDEVHRFAVKYHRKLRDRRFSESILEKVKGIGKKRRLMLLKEFGSIDAIKMAEPEEIMRRVPGIGRKVVEELLDTIRDVKEETQ